MEDIYNKAIYNKDREDIAILTYFSLLHHHIKEEILVEDIYNKYTCNKDEIDLTYLFLVRPHKIDDVDTDSSEKSHTVGFDYKKYEE